MAKIYSIMPIKLGYSSIVFNLDGSIKPNSKLSAVTNITVDNFPYAKIKGVYDTFVEYVNTTPVGTDNTYINLFNSKLTTLLDTMYTQFGSRASLFGMDKSVFDKITRDALIKDVFYITQVGTTYRYRREVTGSSLAQRYGRDRLIIECDDTDPINTVRFVPVSEWNIVPVSIIQNIFSYNTDDITSKLNVEVVEKYKSLLQSWANIDYEVQLLTNAVVGTDIVLNAMLQKIGFSIIELNALRDSLRLIDYVSNTMYQFFDSSFRVSSLEYFKARVYNLIAKYPTYINTIAALTKDTAVESTAGIQCLYTNNIADNYYCLFSPITYTSRYNELSNRLVACTNKEVFPYQGIENIAIDVYGTTTYAKAQSSCNMNLYTDSVVHGYKYPTQMIGVQSTQDLYGAVLGRPYITHVSLLMKLAFIDPRMFNSWSSDERVFLYMMETYKDARVPESKIPGWYLGSIDGPGLQRPSSTHTSSSKYTGFNPFIFTYPVDSNYTVANSVAVLPTTIISDKVTTYNCYTTFLQCWVTGNDLATIYNSGMVYQDPKYCTSAAIYEVVNKSFTAGILGNLYDRTDNLTFTNVIRNDTVDALNCLITSMNTYSSCMAYIEDTFDIRAYNTGLTDTGSSIHEMFDSAYKLYAAITCDDTCIINNAYGQYKKTIGNLNVNIPMQDSMYKHTCGRTSGWFVRGILYNTTTPNVYGVTKYNDEWKYCYYSADKSSALYGWLHNDTNTNAAVNKDAGDVWHCASKFGQTNIVQSGWCGIACKISGKYTRGYVPSVAYDAALGITNVPSTNCELAPMIYALHSCYAADNRNNAFSEQWNNYGARIECNVHSTVYSSGSIEMLGKIAEYCANMTMLNSLQWLCEIRDCYTAGNYDYNNYSSTGARMLGYTIETSIQSVLQNKSKYSKIDNISRIEDTISFIDHWVDNIYIGTCSNYIDLLASKLTKHLGIQFNDMLFSAVAVKERNKVISDYVVTAKYKQYVDSIRYTTTESDNALVTRLFDVTSVGPITSIFQDVFGRIDDRSIPTIKTTFDINSAPIEQNNEYGIRIKDSSGKVTLDTSTVLFNAIGYFKVTGSTITKIVPIDSILLKGDTNTNSTTTGPIKNVVDGVLLQAQNSITSRSVLPLYTELRVITIPSSTNSILSENYNYYRARLVTGGVYPSIELYAQSADNIADTTVIILGR